MYGPCTGPSRLPRGLLRSPCRNVMNAQLPATAIQYPYKIARVLVRDPVKPSTARTGYTRANLSMCHLPRTGHAQAPEDCLGAFYGHKIVGSFACSVFSHSYTALLRIQKSSKILRARTACPVITQGFPRSWSFNCPGASCDIGINIVSF